MTDTGAQGSKGRDLREIFLVLSSTFGTQALLLVTGVLTARALGPEGRGIVALVLAVPGLVIQFSLGSSLPTAITRGVARRHVPARDGLAALTRRWWWVLLLPAPVAAVAVVLLVRGQDSSSLVVLGLLAAGSAVLGGTSRLVVAAIQAESRIGRLALAVLIPQAGFALALSLGIAVGYGFTATSVLVAFVATSGVGLMMQLAALRRPTHDPSARLDEAEFWTDTRSTYVSSVRPLDSAQLDRILVGGFFGAAPLGLYAAGLAVSNVCGFVGMALSVLVLPKVSQAHHNPGYQRVVSRRWILVAAALCVPLVVVMQLLVEPIIRLAFGTPFLPAVEVARWLIVADGFFGLRKVVISVLQGQGRGGSASTVEFAMVPILLVGVGISAAAGSLVAVGITLAVVAAIACTTLLVLTFRSAAQPLAPQA